VHCAQVYDISGRNRQQYGEPQFKNDRVKRVNDKSLRQYIGNLLLGREAHADWKTAFASLSPKLRGIRPDRFPNSAWELLEHMRIAQWDILEFSRNAKHVSPDWPGGYWPETPTPPNAKAWDESLRTFARDLSAMRRLVANPKTDLLAHIPHGTGQTVLREALLLADHNSYHLGQVVVLRRLLGAWKDS
jgi:uncharacterized damage-inducible protein DinB